MLIFLRDTDVDGQPIIGQGLLIRDETPLAVARAMQSTSPFNAGDLAAYMRRVLAAAGDDAPLTGLPEETPGSPTEPPDEAVAREFLERLARRGRHQERQFLSPQRHAPKIGAVFLYGQLIWATLPK